MTSPDPLTPQVSPDPLTPQVSPDPLTPQVSPDPLTPHVSPDPLMPQVSSTIIGSTTMNQLTENLSSFLLEWTQARYTL